MRVFVINNLKMSEGNIIVRGNATERRVDYYCSKHSGGCGCVFYVDKVLSLECQNEDSIVRWYTSYSIICPDCKRKIVLEYVLAKKCLDALK